MAEGSRQHVRSWLGTGTQNQTLNRAILLALDWYGLFFAAIFGLFGAMLYVLHPDVMHPIFDDSFISLTFARNLAQHGKLSFDGEHWSTGATSPLHVTLMAMFLKLGADPFKVSVLFGAAGHVVLSMGVYLLAWGIFRSRLAAILAALAIAFTSYAALDAGNGLETSMFLALVAFVGATYFLLQERWGRVITGCLIAAAILTRPEGVALLPAALIYRWIDRPEGDTLENYIRDVVALALPGVLAGAAIVLYSLIVNGTLGGTASAKLKFFQEDKQSLGDKISIASDQVGSYVAPLISLLALSAVVVNRKQALFAVLFWVPVLIAYVIFFPGGLSHYFYRYQHPILPFIAAFAGGGAAYLIVLAKNHRNYAVKALVVAGLVIAMLPMYVQYKSWRNAYTGASIATHEQTEAMALDLNTIVQPDESLATHDIGAVGYFGDYKVVDLVGLVNEDVIKFHDGRHVQDYIDAVRPTYILVFSDWDYYFLHLDAADNPERYQYIKEYPTGDTWFYYLYRVIYP